MEPPAQIQGPDARFGGKEGAVFPPVLVHRLTKLRLAPSRA